DPLPDPVRPAAEDHDLAPPPAGARLVITLLVGRVEVGRVRLELRPAGVDGIVDGLDAARAAAAHGILRRAEQLAEAGVGEARLLERPEPLGGERLDRLPGERALLGDDLLDVAAEPGSDRREIEDLVHPE